MKKKSLFLAYFNGTLPVIALVVAITSFYGSCNNNGPTGTVGGIWSLNFLSNKGNFTANGKYDTTRAYGTGVGGFRSTSSKNIIVFGYRINSATDVDVVVIGIADTGAIHSGTYIFTGNENVLFLHYYPHVSSGSLSNLGYPYALTSGNFVISSISSTDIQGTFSGRGAYVVNPSDSITVTNGSFVTSLEVVTSMNVVNALPKVR